MGKCQSEGRRQGRRRDEGKRGKSEVRRGQGRHVLQLADLGDAALRHACHRSCHTSTSQDRAG
eukprot:scaffold35127_cov69-Phaeocystis_antarctica.AAC.4